MSEEAFEHLDEEGPGAGERLWLLNRCRYWMRRRGCYMAENCDFCHRHPIPRSLTGGGVVDPVAGPKMRKRERQARAAAEAPEKKRRRTAWKDLYKQMGRNIRED